MKVHFRCLQNAEGNTAIACLEELQNLGSVRTEQIKRTAKELMARFPEKFSHDFEKNKQTVTTLTQGTTTKIRNQIAGYITHALADMQPEPSAEEEPE